METYNSIEVAKQLVKDGKISQEIAEAIFPELKSEDEEMIEIIRGAIFTATMDETTRRDALAWLEKQGSQNLANSAKTCKDEQKPAWSEEDERSIRDSIFYLKSAKKYFEKDDDILWDEKWFDSCIGWLETLYKRLQPQQQWKPSDEQMEALLKLEEMHVLEHDKNQENAHLYMVVKSLREQLLKL